MSLLYYAKNYCSWCITKCKSSDTLPDARWHPHGQGKKDDGRSNSGNNLKSDESGGPVRNESFYSRQHSYPRTSSSSVDIRRGSRGSRDGSLVCQGSFLYSGPSCDESRKTSPYFKTPISAYKQSTPSIFCKQSSPSLQRVPSMTDAEFTMPEMNQCSSIMSPYQISALFLTFPPRLRLYPWTLIHSLKHEGCSLAKLYSRVEKYDHTLLIVIKDTKRSIFGAVLSPPNLKLRGKTYYGTCETFIFTFYPRLQKYNASGENNYFTMGMPDGITIGGWLPALWLDNNLERGTTNCSPTFDNLPLTDENFIVRDMECWALAEPEYMDEMNLVGSLPIYKQFDSSLLAEKKPEKEVGGVRCGRKARNYHPMWKPEASTRKGDRKIFKLGEESDEEEDVFKEDHIYSPRRSEEKCQPHCQEVCTPQERLKEPQHHRRGKGGSMVSPIMAASWGERYR